MIGKTVEYQSPDTRTFSMNTGIIMDKILIDNTDFYLIENRGGEIDTIRCDKIKSIT